MLRALIQPNSGLVFSIGIPPVAPAAIHIRALRACYSYCCCQFTQLLLILYFAEPYEVFCFVFAPVRLAYVFALIFGKESVCFFKVR